MMKSCIERFYIRPPARCRDASRKPYRVIAVLAFILFIILYEKHEALPTCQGLVTFMAYPGETAIPKIIHVYEGNDTSPREFAVNAYGRAQREKVTAGGNYTYMNWNATSFADWMRKEYDWYVSIMSEFSQEEIARIVPFFVLPKFGGISLAANYILRVDPYPYLAQDRVTLLESNMPYSEVISTAVVASKADHPLWMIVHEKLLRGDLDVGQMIEKHPAMIYMLPCENFNRISDRSGMVKHTRLRKKCGLEEDPCLYGSMQ